MSKRSATVPEMDARLWLAVLGKHPGWNDHLDDIGLDTDRLVAVKRQLYVEGVGGLINAGTWESMDAASRDEGFAHSFFWRQPDGMVVGRMWSSSDGKGRSKYPMIACVMCRELPMSFMAGPVLERLRRLEATCRSVSTAGEVIAAADAMREELHELVSFAPALGEGAYEGEPAIVQVADAPGMSEDGLRRVLYQTEREMAAYLKTDGDKATGSRSRSVEVRAQHMRVPRLFPTEAQAWSAWARLFLARVDPLASMLLVCRDDRPWVDVVLGEPSSGQLGCLQGTTEAYPLTTEIPFTIDEASAEAFDARLRSARDEGASETDPCYVDVPQDRLAPFLKKPRAATSAASPEQKKQMLIAVVAAAVVLVLAVVLAVALLGGGGKETAEADGSGESRGGAEVETADRGASGGSSGGSPGGSSSATAGGGADADPSDEGMDAADRQRMARFREWVNLYGGWYEPFVAGLDRGAAASDAHLSGDVLPAIEAIESGDPIDPLAIVPGRYASLDELLANPHKSVTSPELGRVAEAAIEKMERVRSRVTPEGWTLAGLASSVVARLDEAGGAVPPGVSGGLAALGGDDGGAAAEAALGLASVAEPVREVSEKLDAIGARAGEIEAAGAAAQADLVRDAVASLAPSGEAGTDAAAWWSAVDARADRLLGEADRALSAAKRDLPRVDPGLFEAAMASAPASDDPIESLRRWASVLQDRSLYLLDPAEDPRRVLPEGEELDAIARRIADLGGEEDDGRAAAIAEAFAGWQGEAASLNGLSWNESTQGEVRAGVASLNERYAAMRRDIDGLERERRLQAEAYLADVRAEAGVSETGSEAIDEAWRRARDRELAVFERDRDLVDLSRRIDATRERLRAIEAAVPMPALSFGVLAEGEDAAAEAARVEREAALGAMADDAAGRDGAVASFDAWASAVGEALAAAADVREAMSDLRGFGEPAGPAGSTVADRAAVVGSSWIAGVDGAVTGELAACVRAAALDGRAEMVEAVTAPDEVGSAGVLLASWLALSGVEPAWPADAGEARADRAARERILAAIAGRGDEAAARARSAIAEVARDRWLRALDGAADRASFEAIAALAPEGVDRAALPPDVAFDLTVLWLGDLTSTGATPEASVVLGMLEGLGDGLPAEAAAWADGLRAKVAGREDAPTDYRAMGPGRVGWGVEHFQNGRRLVYSFSRADGSVLRLGFLLVEAPGGAVYLGQTELPSSALFDAVLAGERGEATLGFMQPDWDPYSDARAGPRTWTWRRARGGGRAIQESRAWVGDEEGYYAPEIAASVGRPDGMSPLQRVSAEAAAAIAASLGCRLPTAGEWAAAAGGLGATDAANLRDQTFALQLAHAALLAQNRAARWPDEGAFPWGEGTSGGGAACHGWSDDTLWFDGVPAEPRGEFHDLVGNVGEFVLSAEVGAVEPGLLTDRGEWNAGAIRGAMGRGAFSAVGASALSPIEMAPGRAVAVPRDAGAEGYSDVGVRLAFSPGGEMPLSVILSEALADAPFLRESR